MSIYLSRMGFRVSIYERRGDPRALGYVGGRSINLALSCRGLRGLAGVGLAQHVLGHDALPMPGRIVHPAPPNGGRAAPTVFQPYSSNPSDAINSVSRGGLNMTLLSAAEREGVAVRFDHTCLDIDLDSGVCHFQRPDGSVVASPGSSGTNNGFVLGCDGAFSPVRLRLQRTDRFEYSQSYLAHGYKELHVPPAPAGSTPYPAPGGDACFAMDPRGLHIWPRGGAMMIALPNRDGSFTNTLFWPFTGEHGLETRRDPDGVRVFFERHYPDAVPLMPTLAEDFVRNPASSLVTVRCWPWAWQDRACLLGDAAHAIVPFYGQGMNCGFEDCAELAACLAREPRDRGAAFERFQAVRKPNADAIADMALENFVEMRDAVGSPAFLARKRVEQTLHRLFPDRYEPQYNLVSFSNTPYAAARQRGLELGRTLDRVLARLGDVGAIPAEEWDRRIADAARVVETGRAGGASFIDASPALSPSINVWPGDTPLSREVVCELSKGATVTLSTMRSTVHLGAHVDGPNHYVDTIGGRPAHGVGEWPLDRFLGPCHVLDVRARRGTRITPDQVVGLIGVRHPRVLLRSGTFPDHQCWNSDFAALSVELVDALAALGVITIGVDTPSVDLQDSKDLPAHKAIARHGIAIIEGLVLADAGPGEYDLVAQPLKLMGFDASPIRAVLRALA